MAARKWCENCVYLFACFKELFYVLDKILGCDDVWICGDNFAATTYRKYFLCRSEILEEGREANPFNSYIKDKFEYNMFCNSRFNSPTQNMLVRIQNTVAAAINNNTSLPRYICVGG